MKVLVIGGGAIGLSLAWELAQRNVSVTLVERGHVGRETSWAGAGILPPPAQHTFDPIDKLRSLSHTLHADWAKRLLHITGIDNGFRRCGGLYLATSPGEIAALSAQAYEWQADGIVVEKLNVSDLTTIEPALQNAASNTRIRCIYRLPEECQLRNPRHLQALAAACIQSGVQIRDNEELLAIDSANHQVRSVTTSRARYTPDAVCICSGAWANQWLQQCGGTSGIYPVRGQMLLFRLPQPIAQHVINEGHRYLVPREDGYVLAGSSEEEVGFETGTTPEVIETLKAWSCSLIPQLRDAELARTWSGFRPATIDGFPYLGKFPEMDNLYLAAGHFRSGLHLSPGTAVCMADLMLDREPPVSLEAFRIQRGYTAIHQAL